MCVAMCCSVLQCVAVCCREWVAYADIPSLHSIRFVVLQCVAVCVVVFCSGLQCVLQCVLQHVLQHVLQRVLQCVAESKWHTPTFLH